MTTAAAAASSDADPIGSEVTIDGSASASTSASTSTFASPTSATESSFSSRQHHEEEHDEYARARGDERGDDDEYANQSVPETPTSPNMADNVYTVDPSLRAAADSLAAQLHSHGGVAPSTTTTTTTIKRPFVLDTTLHVRLDQQHFTQSFEPLIFRKLAQTLATNHDLPLKISALDTCIELSRRVQNIRLLIDQGVFEELVINSGDEEVRVKHLATLALVEITKHRAGRDYAFTTSLVSSFPSLLIDPHSSVRLHTTTILLNLSLFSPFLLNPISASSLRLRTEAPPCLLSLLVERIELEKDTAVRHGCVRVVVPMLRKSDGWNVACLANVVPICAKSLNDLAPHLASKQQQPPQQHHHQAVAQRKLAAALCECIAYTSIAHASKLQSVAFDLVALLFQLVAVDDAAVRVQAAAALRNITIAEDAKRVGVACGGIDVSLERLSGETDAQALIGVLQTLAHLVECPEGRLYRDRVVTQPKYVEQLRKLGAKFASTAQVGEYAKIALERIQWRP